MGAMSAKFQDLQALNAQIASGQTIAAIQFLGTPNGDGFRGADLSNGRFKIVDDIDDLAVGDLAYAGNQVGYVKEILDDGEASPVNNRVVVEYPTLFKQSAIDTSPTIREVTYNFATNDDAVATDPDEKLNIKEALLSLGVVFLKEYAVTDFQIGEISTV